MKRTSMTLILLGFICLIAFDIIGSEVDSDGKLVEPFFLIPISWLCFITGGILAVAQFIKRRIAK